MPNKLPNYKLPFAIGQLVILLREGQDGVYPTLGTVTGYENNVQHKMVMHVDIINPYSNYIPLLSSQSSLEVPMSSWGDLTAFDRVGFSCNSGVGYTEPLRPQDDFSLFIFVDTENQRSYEISTLPKADALCVIDNAGALRLYSQIMRLKIWMEKENN